MKTVVDRDLCYGCGVCAALCPAGAIRMLRERGEALWAVIDGEKCTDCGACRQVCPALGWEGVATPMFLTSSAVDRCLQPRREMGVGYALDTSLRRSGTSGGLVTAVLLELLRTGEVDSAVVVRQAAPLKAEALLARTEDEVRSAQKSKYIVAPYDQVLRQAQDCRSVALVGLPCHLEGVRRASLLLPNWAERIRFKISLLCAANLRLEVYRYLLRARGLSEDELVRWDFRPGDWWRQDYFRAVTSDDRSELFAFRHGILKNILPIRLFAREACLMCPDFSGRSADLSVGDAWFERYKGERAGRSFYVARTERAQALLDAMRERDSLCAEPVDLRTFCRSSNLWTLASKHVEVRGRAALRRMAGRPVPPNIPARAGPVGLALGATIYLARRLTRSFATRGRCARMAPALAAVTRLLLWIGRSVEAVFLPGALLHAAAWRLRGLITSLIGGGKRE